MPDRILIENTAHRTLFQRGKLIACEPARLSFQKRGLNRLRTRPGSNRALLL